MKGSPYLIWTLAAIALTGAIGLPLHWATGLPPAWSYLVAVNFATLLLYRIDKWISPYENAPRVPNVLLVLSALAGGSVAAIFGVAAGHKTSRRYLWLRILLWVFLVGHLAVVYCALIDSTGICRRVLGQLLP
jgi:uncharacterized membrane protein YsdA (DUF1294 family)